jgi:hypothetical protein
MLNAYKKTADSDLSYTQPENANLSSTEAGTQISPASGVTHRVAVTAQAPYVDLKALVVDGKVALQLSLADGSVVSLGEPDTLEITGPPNLSVALRAADIVDGNGMTLYAVNGKTEESTTTARWTRNASDTGTECSLQVPAGAQEETFKFTMAAAPCLGSLSTPLPLDPYGIIKKEG